NKKYKTSQVELYLRQDHSSHHNLSPQNQHALAGQQRLKLGDFLLSDTSMNIDINSQYIYGCQVTFDKFVSSKVTSTTTTTSRFILKDMREQYYRMNFRGIKEVADGCEEVNENTLPCKPEVKTLNDKKKQGAITCDGDYNSEQKSGSCPASSNKVCPAIDQSVQKRSCPVQKPRLKTALKRQRNSSVNDPARQSKCKNSNERHSCRSKTCSCRKTTNIDDRRREPSENVTKNFCSSRVRAKNDNSRSGMKDRSKTPAQSVTAILTNKRECQQKSPSCAYEKNREKVPARSPTCQNTGPKSCGIQIEPNRNKSCLKNNQKTSQSVAVDKCKVRNEYNTCSISRQNSGSIISCSPKNQNSAEICPLEDHQDKGKTIKHVKQDICKSDGYGNYDECKTDQTIRNLDSIGTVCSCKSQHVNVTCSCKVSDKNVNSCPSQNSRYNHKDQLCSCKVKYCSCKMKYGGDKDSLSSCSCKIIDGGDKDSLSTCSCTKKNDDECENLKNTLNERDKQKERCTLESKPSIRILLPHKDGKMRTNSGCELDRVKDRDETIDCMGYERNRWKDSRTGGDNRYVDSKRSENRCSECKIRIVDSSRSKNRCSQSRTRFVEGNPNENRCIGCKEVMKKKRPGSFFDCLDIDRASNQQSNCSEKRKSSSVEKKPPYCNSIPLGTIVEKPNEYKDTLLPPPPAKGILKRTTSSVDKYVSAKSSQCDLIGEEDDDCPAKPNIIKVKLKPHVELKPQETREKSREKFSEKVRYSQKSVKQNQTCFKNQSVGCNLSDSTKEGESYESKHFIQHLLDLIRSFNGEKKECSKSSTDEYTDGTCTKSTNSDKRRKLSHDSWTNISNAKIYEYERGVNGSSKVRMLKYVENDVCAENAEGRTSRNDGKQKKNTSCDKKRSRDVVSSRTCKCELAGCKSGNSERLASNTPTNQHVQKYKQENCSRNEQTSQKCKQEDASRNKERTDTFQKDKTRAGDNTSQDTNSKSCIKSNETVIKIKLPQSKEKSKMQSSQSTTSSDSSDYISTSSRSKCSSCDDSSSHSQTNESSVCDTCKCLATSQSNTSMCTCHLHCTTKASLTPQSSVTSRKSGENLHICNESKITDSSNGKTSSETQSPKEDDEECKVKQDKSKKHEAQRTRNDGKCEKKKESYAEDTCKKHRTLKSVKQNICCVERKDSYTAYGSSHSITISACSSEIYSFLGSNEVVETVCSDCKKSVCEIGDGKDCQEQKEDKPCEKGKKEMCTKAIEEKRKECELDKKFVKESRTGNVCKQSSIGKEDTCKCNNENSKLKLSKTLDMTFEMKNNESCDRNKEDDCSYSKSKEKFSQNVCEAERTNKISKIREKFECDLKLNHELRKDKCECKKLDEEEQETYKYEIQEECTDDLAENDANQCLINEEYPKICKTIEKYENNTCNENAKTMAKEKFESEGKDTQKKIDSKTKDIESGDVECVCNNEKLVPAIAKNEKNDCNIEPEVEQGKDNKVSSAKLKFEEKIQKAVNEKKCGTCKSSCKKSQERSGSCNSRVKNTEGSKHIQFLQEIKNVHDKIMANKCTDVFTIKTPDHCVSPKEPLKECMGETYNREKCINKIINADVRNEETKTCNALTQSGGDNFKGNENKTTTKNVQTEKCVGFLLDEIEKINQDDYDDDYRMPKKKCSMKEKPRNESCDKRVTFVDDVISEQERCERVQNDLKNVDCGERKKKHKKTSSKENKSDTSIPPESRRRKLSNRRSERWTEGILDCRNLDRRRSSQKCLKLFDVTLDYEENGRAHRKNSPSVKKERRKSKSRSRSRSNRSENKRTKDDMEGNVACSRTSMKRGKDKDPRKREYRQSDHHVSADQFFVVESKSCHRLEVKESGKQPFAAANHSRVSRTEVCYFASSQKKITSDQRCSQKRMNSEQRSSQNSSQKKITSEKRFSQKRITSEQRFIQKKITSEQLFSQNSNKENIASKQRYSNAKVNFEKYPILEKTNRAVPLNQTLSRREKSARKCSTEKSKNRLVFTEAREIGARTRTIPHVSSKIKFTNNTIEPKEDLSDSDDGDSKLIDEAFEKVYTELESYFKNKQNLSDTLAHLSSIEKLTDKILNKEGLTDQQPLEMNFSSSYTEYLLEKSLDEMGQFEEKFEKFLARKQLRCYHTFNQDLTQESSSVGTAASRLQSAQTTRVWSRQAEIRCNRFSINFENDSLTCEPNLPLHRNMSYLHSEWKPKHRYVTPSKSN
ncbi:hypothetical protein WDU94_006310, partial [Cyamophila willieti]